MRVLVVTNMYPTADEPGFAPFVQEQVEALRARPQIEAIDVMIIDGRSSTLNYFRAFPEIRRRIRAGAYDLVHAHYGLSGAVALVQRRVPVVVTYHGSDVDDDHPSKRWQRWVSRFVARHARANITVSAPIQARLGHQSELIPCGIDMAAFSPANRAEARRQFNVADGSLALLFPSTPRRIEKEYGRFETVVDAVRATGRSVHPIVLEGFARHEVPILMAACDVMVMTSSVEGSPVAIMEALACGLPVVATDVGDVRAMLADTDLSYVDQFSAVAFADAAMQFDDPNRVRQPHRGADRFDMDRIVDRLVALYADSAAIPASVR